MCPRKRKRIGILRPRNMPSQVRRLALISNYTNEVAKCDEIFFQRVGRDKRAPPASGVVVSGDGGGNEVGDAVFGLADERGRDAQTRGDVRRRFAFL